MSWERRLREVLLAGGALATAACSTSNGSNFPTGSDAGGGHDATASEGGLDATFSTCCNANPDPCCAFKYCGGDLTPECCEVEGGILSADGGSCVPFHELDDASSEAGPDGASADANPHD